MERNENNKEDFEFTIFTEDVVCLKPSKRGKTKHQQFGVVQRVAGKDDDNDSVTDSTDEELDEGEVVVLWENGEEEIIEAEKLIVTDRSFLHGDILAKLDDPFGQSGTVLNVKLLCDVETSDKKKVMKKVDSRKLKLIHAYRRQLYTVYKTWLCRIDSCFFDLVVQFRDGSKCKLLKVESDKLFDDDDYYEPNDPFYPGQKLYFNSNYKKHMLRQAIWIAGKYDKDRHLRGTVINVTVSDVVLDFISTTTSDMSPPSEPIDLKNVQVFQYFFHTNFQVGDRGYFDADDQYSDYSVMQGTKDENGEITDADFSQNIVTVKRTYTTVDVQWQDGTYSYDVPATFCIPLHHLGDFDFWPEDFVTEKNDDETDSVNKRVGIVQQVDAKQRTCKVKWINNAQTNQTSVVNDEEDELSIFDIKNHTDYQFSLGDVVLQLNSDCNGDWAGELITIKNGYFTVSWISGAVTTIRYCDVLSAQTVVDDVENVESDEEDVESERHHTSQSATMRVFDNSDVEDDESDQEDVDDVEEVEDDDANSWETVSSASEEEEEDDEDEDDQDEEETFYLTNGLDQQPRPNRIGFKSQSSHYIADDEIELQPRSAPVQALDKTEKDAIAANLFPLDPVLGVPKFEIVETSTTEDHKFINEEEPPLDPNFLKVIHNEWQLLRDNLPDGIFVKVYESRMDIIRAVLVGAPHTPYHDGLFTFDIWLTADYPSEPPKVSFHSFGEKMNPNLYENGEVCLSLLGTWEARQDCEAWNPETSNVLQVLLSLQGLVLVSEPYYNEAGYDAQINTKEGKHNSSIYNENAYLQTSNHMLKMLTKPPLHCSSIVTRHALVKHAAIFKRMRNYLSDQIEEYNVNENGLDENGLHAKQISKGFKLRLQKILARLESKCK